MIRSMLKKVILWALRDDTPPKNLGIELDAIAKELKAK